LISANLEPHCSPVIWPNLNTPDAISITTLSHLVFRTSILGIYYFDAATGQSASVATVQDSIGELLPPNQVLYRDAFNQGVEGGREGYVHEIGL